MKNTKKALLASVVSLLLCVTMLMGSTFAWFTDTATTGVNKITAGNLDVTFEYSFDMNTWANAEGATEIFGSDILWEPGYTKVVYLKVTNNGTLAADILLGTNLVKNTIGKSKGGDLIDLTEILKFAILENVTAPFDGREAIHNAVTDPANFGGLYATEHQLAQKGDSIVYAMVVYMPTDVDNKANHDGVNIPSVEFGIEVIASQSIYEEDSFGNDYDINAAAPSVANGEYSTSSEQILNGEGFKATIPAGSLSTVEGAPIPDKTQLIMKVLEADPDGNVSVDAGSIKETFEISLMTANDEKVVSDATAPIKVELQIGAGRTGTLKLYHYETEVPFISYDPASGILTFETTSFSPYTVVELDVVTADEGWYADAEASEYVIMTADELAGFAALVNAGNTFAGKTVKLGADIDLMNAAWEPIGHAVIANNNYDWKNSPYFAGSFDGQGHTISNLFVDDPDTNIRGLFGYGKIVEIKNLNIHNASVTGLRRSAVLIGQNDGTCHFSNINITGDVNVCVIRNEAGTLVGRGGVGKVLNVTVDVNEGSAVECVTTSSASWEYVGGVWGHAWPTLAENVSSNIDVYAYASSTGGIGGGCAINSNNVTCSGNVTLGIKDSEIHKGSICCWQTNGLIYGFGVGSSNESTQTACSSTGTITVGGEVVTATYEENSFVGNGARFGAPYNANGVITIVD